MPNNASNKPKGSSFKNRVRKAAEMTAEQRNGEATPQKRSGSSRIATDKKSARAHGTRPASTGPKPRKATADVRERAKTESKSKREVTRPPRNKAEAVKHVPSEVAGGAASVIQRVNERLSMRARIVILVVLILVLLVAFLYPASKNYYTSLRQEQKLEAQLSAVEQRNETIQNENDKLNTDEGVKDAAREEFGWVEKGDSSAVVSGSSSSDGSNLPGQVSIDDIGAPHTWYYDILDTIFFVKA